MKLGNPKNAFWEALFLTTVVFIFGLLLGVIYEGSKVDEISNYYAFSEISMMDGFVLNNAIDLENSSCEVIIDANINFADRIYKEALLLEKYESSGKITEDLILAHKKYDLLRTFLWVNSNKALEKCGEEFSIVVYLYEYELEDLVKKAKHSVWSKILIELKEEKGNEIILIPIAVDSGLVSLEPLINRFDIQEYPAVIIDNQYMVQELESVDNLKEYFN